MPYQFATEDRDYSDYASGRVFYAAPGHPAFPVRLISEVFQRCQALRRRQGLTGPVTLYDPCCGSAYQLSTLAYLHWAEIGSILASDIDADILPVAVRNLGLLTPAGLEKRAGEITDLLERYDKPSHMEAAVSVKHFRQHLNEQAPSHPISTRVFQADATQGQELRRELAGQPIDLVLADVPYGRQSHWQTFESGSAGDNDSLLGPLLEALLEVISPQTIVAILSDKAQKAEHPQYQRLGRFQIGKRLVSFSQRK
jgi:hypothetical protein